MGGLYMVKLMSLSNVVQHVATFEDFDWSVFELVFPVIADLSYRVQVQKMVVRETKQETYKLIQNKTFTIGK